MGEERKKRLKDGKMVEWLNGRMGKRSNARQIPWAVFLTKFEASGSD